MRDIDWLFLLLTLFNTNIGMYNSQKNEEERKHQNDMTQKIDEINEKMDRILEGLKDER